MEKFTLDSSMTSWLIHLRFGLACVAGKAPFAGIALDGRMRGTIRWGDGTGCGTVAITLVRD